MMKPPPALRRISPNWLKRSGRRLLASAPVERAVTELTYRFRRQRIEELLVEAQRVPRGLHLEATNICNARCVFWAYPQMERPKQTMSMEMFRDIIDQYVASGGSHVSLTPIVGDPFVDPLLFERLDYLAELDAIESFYFFTNAILMNRDASQQLMRYGDRLRVCISMGGFDRETYHRVMGVDRFESVWPNLEAFLEEVESSGSEISLEIHVRCGPEDLRGEVWGALEELERQSRLLIAQIDEYDSWAGKISPEALAESGLRPSRMPHKRGPCELLYMKPVVLANGEVNACACRDVEAELIVGDLGEQSLEEVFEGDALTELRNRQMRGDFPDVCQRCSYYVSVFNPLKSRIASDELNWDTGMKD
jgi:MoaA/NifB/PqqE/SkfB family radical SAM enzyme